MHKNKTFTKLGGNRFETNEGWVILFNPQRTIGWRMGRNLEGDLVLDSELAEQEFKEALSVMESLD